MHTEAVGRSRLTLEPALDGAEMFMAPYRRAMRTATRYKPSDLLIYAFSPLTVIDVAARVASDWTDPEFPSRKEAVHQTLHADNSFTAEATAFALNRCMSLMSKESLQQLFETARPEVLEEAPDAESGQRPLVVVRHGAATPVEGLREAVAAMLMGARVRSVLPASSPALIPAFYKDLRAHGPDIDVACLGSVEELPRDERGTQDAGDFTVVCVSAEGAGSGTSAASDDLKAWCGAEGGVWIERQHGYTVGIIDGSEPDDVRHDLAEDALLHEGQAADTLRVLWAPDDLTPDPMLQAMADFRGVFPAHEDTPGSLEMRRAFLEAADQSHAYAAGMQFLVSRGAPEPQDGAHLRWSEYENLADVAEWVTEHAHEVDVLVVRPQLAERLPESLQPESLQRLGIEPVEPGRVHRKPLGTPRVRRVLEHL